MNETAKKQKTADGRKRQHKRIARNKMTCGQSHSDNRKCTLTEKATTAATIRLQCKQATVKKKPGNTAKTHEREESQAHRNTEQTAAQPTHTHGERNRNRVNYKTDKVQKQDRPHNIQCTPKNGHPELANDKPKTRQQKNSTHRYRDQITDQHHTHQNQQNQTTTTKTKQTTKTQTQAHTFPSMPPACAAPPAASHLFLALCAATAACVL